MLNVIEFPQSNLMDVPAMLRNLADAIEAGDHGDVTTAFVVVPADDDDAPSVFAFGEDTAPADASFQLQLANQFLLTSAVTR